MQNTPAFTPHRHMKMFTFVIALLAMLSAVMFGGQPQAASGEKPVKRDYSKVTAPPAPAQQTLEEMMAKSDGCYSCHVKTDAPTMHTSPAVRLGCVDCHGGNPKIKGDSSLPHSDPAYVAARDLAHVLPKYPQGWHFPSSANPKRTYTLLNKEAPEFVRFVNPSDYRVARESCGACHMPIIEAGERSIMATGAMLWGGAAYNNGIAPFKNYIFGEAFTRDGKPAKLVSPGAPPGTLTENQIARGALAELYPLPTWQVIPPADVFRVFERGGRTINSQFPEIGLPSPTGSIQRLEEPGRPDLKQSNRGPGTGLRVAIPVLNIHKTRLNDPFMWFMGTNDQPGDYRHSGCAACHVVYANDREPRHSLIYAKYGRDGQTITVDPTIKDKLEPKGYGDGHGSDDGHGHSDDKASGHGGLKQPGDDHSDEADKDKNALKQQRGSADKNAALELLNAIDGEQLYLRFATRKPRTLTRSPASIHVLLDFDGDDTGAEHRTHEYNQGEVWEENEFWVDLSWRIDPDGTLAAQASPGLVLGNHDGNPRQCHEKSARPRQCRSAP
mgnify:CR=1 FL=1